MIDRDRLGQVVRTARRDVERCHLLAERGGDDVVELLHAARRVVGDLLDLVRELLGDVEDVRDAPVDQGQLGVEDLGDAVVRGTVDRAQEGDDRAQRLDDRAQVEVAELVDDAVEVRALEVDPDTVRVACAVAETERRIDEPVRAGRVDRQRGVERAVEVEIVGEVLQRPVGSDRGVETEATGQDSVDESGGWRFGVAGRACVAGVVQELAVAQRVAERRDLEPVLGDRVAGHLADVS